jgi:hypothetical protein
MALFYKTSGVIRGNDEIQARKEAILSDDKYERARAKDGARFNLSSKKQRIGDIAAAIRKRKKPFAKRGKTLFLGHCGWMAGETGQRRRFQQQIRIL